MKQYRREEWQDATGYWHCEHTSSFPKNVQLWVCPARILGIPAQDYVKLLITQYKPDRINWDGNTLQFSWKSQSQMRKFKNWINAEARKVGFCI